MQQMFQPVALASDNDDDMNESNISSDDNLSSL
jgi:hypothetical protein